MKLDEDEFLAALLPRLATDPGVLLGPGDDCAAIAWNDHECLLLAVDQVAAGAHYFAADNPRPTPPELAGRKLLARNLSDIAAMGGQPRYALAAVAAAPETSREWLDAFADGVLTLAQEFGVTVIGGDLCRASTDVASLTIIGVVHHDQLCRRSAARPGDRIFVTGAFGGSLASEHHLRFTPRVAEGSWLAANGYTSCMIDASDGLLKDLHRVCRASSVDAELDPGRVPRARIDGAEASLEAALLDGEDYELIIAAPAANADALPSAWPFDTPLSEVGHYLSPSDGGGMVRDPSGADLLSRHGPGFEHFSGDGNGGT